MMKKIFLDNNIILDIIEERPAVYYARQILEYSRKNELVHVYATYLTMANSAYILRKRPLAEVKEELKAIMKDCNIIHADDTQIMEAIQNGSPDFEDSLQIAGAETRHCDVIITRNPGHFRAYTYIPVITPEEFVSHCRRS